jgi:hypothetical protein
MNFLKKGPELKRPEMKIPDFLYDLFYDLKERHLLPLVAILLVAIVAVPIFVSSKHSSEEEPVATPTISNGSNVSTSGETITVARSTPGLREIRKRLRNFRAVDPFQQKVVLKKKSAETEEEAAAESPESAVPAEATVIGGESSPETTEVPIYTPGGASGGEGTDGSGGEESGPPRTRYANDAIDVRIVTLPAESANAKSKAKPKVEVRRNLPELSMLPDRSTPAVSFMGTTHDGKKALLVVSSDVVSIFGEATCVIGTQSCQLLALEPGMPVTFVYGPQEKRFRIQVLKITQTLSNKPHRAPLGSSGGKGSGGGSNNGGTSIGNEPAERGGTGGGSEGGGGGHGAAGNPGAAG